jgi:APA family basic amino acid/polyamine antiporter
MSSHSSLTHRLFLHWIKLVARTWGDKVLIWWARMAGEEHTPWLMGILQPVEWINIPASLLCIACTSLLLAGVRESKLVTNVVTAVKMLLVGFMIVGGFLLFQPANMGPPLAPFGTEGVLRGATSSFFGYLGYDEICVVAGEALHPKRDLPRAVLGTLAIVTVCYILAAVALTGMLPYTEISSTSGFPEAFADRDWAWAAQLTAVGEISTLPVVVLISLLAQPRLTFAMAKDGLLPAHIFAPVNEAGETSLWYGTMLSGVVMTLIAAVVPFTYLDDLISCGILVAFSMTNSALIQLRCMPAGMAPASLVATLPRTLTVYHALCFLTALAWNKDGRDSSWTALAVLCTIALVSCLLFILRAYPAIPGFFGGLPTEDSDCHPGETYFTTPAVPFVPCLGIAVNWYLIAQLEVTGLVLLALYLASSLVLYRVWGRPNAHVGGHAYESVCDRPPTGEIAANLVRRRSPAEELRSVS